MTHSTVSTARATPAMPGSRGKPAPRLSALADRRTFRAVAARAQYSPAARLALVERLREAENLLAQGRHAEARQLLGERA